MKLSATIAFMLLVFTSMPAQDSLRRPRRITPIVFSSVSYQVALNGNKAVTDLGNFGFKGYVQPEIGLGLKYQQDSTEFATVALSATRFVFTLASDNRLSDTANYAIMNRMDIYMNNYALTTAYHRRLTHKSQSHYFSLELGAGVHLIQWFGTAHTDNGQVGPYAVTVSVNTPKKIYALPTASAGLNCTLISEEHRTNFLFGLNSELYLDNFWEVQYSAQYVSTNTTLNYSFRWAPVILAPKIYVMAMF